MYDGEPVGKILMHFEYTVPRTCFKRTVDQAKSNGQQRYWMDTM